MSYGSEMLYDAGLVWSFFRQNYAANSVLLHRCFCLTLDGCHSAILALNEVVEGDLPFCSYDKVHGKKLLIAFYESQYIVFSMPGVEQLSEY